MEECKRDRGELHTDRGELDADRGELAPLARWDGRTIEPARVMTRAALRDAAAQVRAGATTWAELGRELGIHARTLRDRAVAAGLYDAERVAVGDELDRFYTPQALADAIVQRLERRGLIAPTVIEPSVGGGAFARAVRSAAPHSYVIGVDADSAAQGLAEVDEAHVGDWPSWARLNAATVARSTVVGNPPFGPLREHLELIRGARVAAVIMPLDRLGRFSELYQRDGRDIAAIWPIMPRPWPKHVRETVVAVFGAGAGVERRQIGQPFAPLVWRRS